MSSRADTTTAADRVLAWTTDPATAPALTVATDDGGWMTTPGADLVVLVDTYAAEIGARLDAVSAAPGDPVTVLADTGTLCVAAFWAALRAGAALVPVAPPGMGDRDRAVERIAGVLDSSGSRLIVVDPRLEQVAAAAVAAAGGRAEVLVLDPAATAPSASAARPAGEHALVQFTSGSTGRPRGVPVTWAALEHNITSILQHIDHRPGDALASWLPLHHDMGLIGIMFTALSSHSDLTLMRPDHFIRSPRRWLEAMSRAAHTASPSFALGLAARRLTPTDVADLDLSGWRSLVLGSEPLRLRDLAPFLDLVEGCGFDRDRVLPSYGMAESTLHTCGLRRGESLSALRLGAAPRPGERLDVTAEWDGTGPVPREGGGERWSLALGRPDADTVIGIHGEDGRVLPDGCFGEISVRGPSVARGYRGGTRADEPDRTRFRDGRLFTGDGGAIVDGRLHVLGRLGTALTVQGRTVLMEDVDAAVVGATGLPAGRVAAVAAETGATPRVTVALEVADGTVPDGAEPAARSLVGTEAHLDLVTTPPGTIPRTTSGKPRRRELAALLAGARSPSEARSSSEARSPSDPESSESAPTLDDAAAHEATAGRPASDDVRALFARVRDRIDLPSGAAVLHEGSLAEGFGNARSDVDFLVLVPGSGATPTMPTVLFADGRRVEVRTRSLRELATMTDSLADASADPGSIAWDRPSADLLNRCQRLVGARVVLDSPTLRELDTPSHSELGDLLRRWWSVRGRHCLCRGIARTHLTDGTRVDGWVREGVVQLVKAWLAGHGETYLESKWTGLQLSRLASGRPDLAGLAERSRGALFDESVRSTGEWLTLARTLDPGSVPAVDRLVLLRRDGVTTWPLDGAVHVLRGTDAVFRLDDETAAVWRRVVPGRTLEHAARGATGASALIEDFLELGLVDLGHRPVGASGHDADRVRPAMAMAGAAAPLDLRPSRSVTAVGPRGAVPGPDDAALWRSPLDPVTFGAVGMNLVWSVIVEENAREDLDGALADGQWDAASAAARRQVLMSVRALLSAEGVHPLPADVDPGGTVGRLLRDEEARGAASRLDDLMGPLTSATGCARSPERVRALVDGFAAEVRRRIGGTELPSSFDGREQWNRTLELAYDWLRLGAHLDSRIPLDEARDLLDSGGRQPHEEADR